MKNRPLNDYFLMAKMINRTDVRNWVVSGLTGFFWKAEIAACLVLGDGERLPSVRFWGGKRTFRRASLLTQNGQIADQQLLLCEIWKAAIP